MKSTLITDVRSLLTTEERAELEALINEQWEHYAEVKNRLRIRRYGVPVRTVAERLGESRSEIHRLEKTVLHKLQHQHRKSNPKK